MANLMDMLYHRRSVRTYTVERIPEEMLEDILKAGLTSESARGHRPWEFILVRDKDMLEKMAHCRDKSAMMLAGADAAIVVLGDADKAEFWTEDCAVAMAHMHLMADSLGLGSCWIQGRGRNAENGVQTSEEYLRELLGFPRRFKLEAVLSLGMTEDHPRARTEEDLLLERIHREHWNGPVSA